MKVLPGQIPSVSAATVSFGYTAAGRRKFVRRAVDGATALGIVSTIYSYDMSGRIDKINNQSATDEFFASYDYGYNSFGLLRGEERDFPGFAFDDTAEYRYDGNAQLVDAVFANQDDEHYEYDANGNRTAAVLAGVRRSYTVDVGNRIVNDGLQSREYDGEGNQLGYVDAETGRRYEYKWDHRNRLVGVTQRDSASEVSVVMSFQYDPLGRRIVEMIDGQISLTRVFDFDNLWATFALGANVTHYLFTNETDGTVAKQREGDGIKWQLPDIVGTVRAEVDASGIFTGVATLTTYGDGVASSGSFATAPLFQGREWLDSVRLYDYRARMYDSSIGRFISQDPLGFDAFDSNQYRFVFNVPTLLTDPFGRTVFGEYGIQARLAAARAAIIECLGYAALTNFGTAGIYILLTSVVNTPAGPADTYVGKTVQTFEARFSQHTKAGKKIVSTVRIPLSNALTPQQIRMAEQLVMNQFGGKAQLVNKINATSKLFCR